MRLQRPSNKRALPLYGCRGSMERTKAVCSRFQRQKGGERMKIACNVTAGEDRGPEMYSGCRVCLVTQPHMLSSCVPWKVSPKSTKQTIYARVAAAKSRMNLRLREILSECDARSEMHSPKDSIFRKSTSQSCRDFHAVCKNPQILSYVTKRDFKSQVLFRMFVSSGG